MSKFIKSAPVVIVLSIFVILVEGEYPYFFSLIFNTSYDPTKIPTMAFIIIYHFLCFVGLPLAINYFLLKEKLVDLGLRLPKRKIMAGFLIIVSLLIVIPYMLYFSTRKEFLFYYSFGSTSLHDFIIIQFMLLPLYYFSEEFFFRGFLFISLWKKVGWHSFWITDIIFTVAHVGKPGLEVLFCIPVSILLNLLSLQTKSIYPAIIVHSSIGISLNFLVRFYS